MEDMWDVKSTLESQGDAHAKVESESNSELQSLTSSPTQSPGPPCLQIGAPETHTTSDLGVLHMHEKIRR
jgi:hypothetical protein